MSVMHRVPSTPPPTGGSGTFSVASWNIRDGRNGGLVNAAKGMADMGIGCAFLSEVKISDNKYAKRPEGYEIIISRGKSKQQGGVALLWKDKHPMFEIENANARVRNLITFQLITGDKRFYVMAIYIAPGCRKGVEDLRNAWAQCPTNCTPIVIGDLNIRNQDPRDAREEEIADLLDEINLVDTSRKFIQRQSRRHGLLQRNRWTWRKKRRTEGYQRGRWIYSQPDYIMAREGDMKHIRKVGIRTPRYHISDHRAVVLYRKAGNKGKLHTYRKQRQCFPVQLEFGPQDEMTTNFEKLRVLCDEPDPKKRPQNNWISEDTWKIVRHMTMLRTSGRLTTAARRSMKRAMWASLANDRRERTKRVGEAIEAELAKGDAQEAFRHLKGWYRDASETEARPCKQMMERQTEERVDLYRKRVSPRAPIPINITPVNILDSTPSDDEIRAAVKKSTNGRAGGASRMRAEHLKTWLAGMEREEDPEQHGEEGAGDIWKQLVKLVQTVWDTGEVPTPLRWVIVVLLPKGGGDYRGIGLLEPIWKIIERVMKVRLDAIELHESLHGCRNKRGTGTAVIEAKLAQQLAHLEQTPFYGIFLDLKKAFDAMDRERCLEILRGYGVGPNMLRLINQFWSSAVMVCRASGNYGIAFKAGRGVTQGGPLSATLFNIVVDCVAREWLRRLREGINLGEDEVERLMAEFLAIFYVDDAYLASRDPDLLQEAMDILVDLFERVGLETNKQKTVAMTCTPGRIRTQLTTASYFRMRNGLETAEDWETRKVVCHQCNKEVQARNLTLHLNTQHNIYPQTSVDADLLVDRPSVIYRARVPNWKGKLECPVPGCLGELRDSYNLRRHFRDLHPKDDIIIAADGRRLPRCPFCRLQSRTESAARHENSGACQLGAQKNTQREAAITSALALRREFTVGEGNTIQVLERVEVFKYLGRLLAQDDDDVQAIRNQIRKARGTWARIGQVLTGENTPPRVSAKFYKAIIQSVLLYGSETWNVTGTALKQLEGFHIRAAYRMARINKPKRGSNNTWTYPRSKDVLEECGLETIDTYIKKRRDTIAQYVATQPIFSQCLDGEQRRGSMPRQWWWEQPMSLDDDDADVP